MGITIGKGLSRSFRDEIGLDKKLAEGDVANVIKKIDEYLAQAQVYEKKGDTDVAKILRKKARDSFVSFREEYPIRGECKTQRKKYKGTVKQLKESEDEYQAYVTETEKMKTEVENREVMAGGKKQEINVLKQQLGIESPHRAYRQAMVEYAKENDKQHAERIEKWAGEVQNHIEKGRIVEDADGVAIPKIGLKTASHAVQEKALTETRGDKKDEEGNALLLPQYGRDDHQNEKSGTQKIQKKYLDKHEHGDQFGDRELGSVEQVDQMRTWIRNNFTDVNTQDDELYILQMINPGLFETMWMKDVDGKSRHYLGLGRDVISSYVSKYYGPGHNCGLFLVQKC